MTRLLWWSVESSPTPTFGRIRKPSATLVFYQIANAGPNFPESSSRPSPRRSTQHRIRQRAGSVEHLPYCSMSAWSPNQSPLHSPAISTYSMGNSHQHHPSPNYIPSQNHQFHNLAGTPNHRPPPPARQESFPPYTPSNLSHASSPVATMGTPANNNRRPAPGDLPGPSRQPERKHSIDTNSHDEPSSKKKRVSLSCAQCELGNVGQTDTQAPSESKK